MANTPKRDVTKPETWTAEEREQGWMDLAKNPDPTGGVVDEVVRTLNEPTEN